MNFALNFKKPSRSLHFILFFKRAKYVNLWVSSGKELVPELSKGSVLRYTQQVTRLQATAHLFPSSGVLLIIYPEFLRFGHFAQNTIQSL